MIQLTISEEVLQKAFNSHIEKLMGDTYSNPVKQVVDDILGYSSKDPIKEELKTVVSTKIKELLDSKEFITMVGEAFAKEIARREADKIARK